MKDKDAAPNGQRAMEDALFRGDIRVVVLAHVSLQRHLILEMMERGLLTKEHLLSIVAKAVEECRLPGNGKVGQDAAAHLLAIFGLESGALETLVPAEADGRSMQ